MAEHKHMKDQLVSLSVGELPERQRAEVRAHAAECDACRAELTHIEKLLGCAGRRKALSAGEAMYASAEDRLLAAISSEDKSKRPARPFIRRAFEWRSIMTSSVTKIAVAAVVAVVVGLFGLATWDRTGPDGGGILKEFPRLASACAAEESLFLGSDIVHILNEIIVYADGGDNQQQQPGALPYTWLPMCSVKADGSLRFNQLKLSTEAESYVVADHSWYDPATGRFARVVKTDGGVVFANSYDGHSVYATTTRPDGTLSVVEEAVPETFNPPQSPAEFLGLAAGLKTALAEDDTMVLSVEEGVLHDGATAHIYKVGTPDPSGNLQGYWLFKVRDADSTIAEKEFVLLGRPCLLIRRVLTESVEAPGASWNLEEVKQLSGESEASPRVSVTPDMVIPRVSVEHMVERADFETYVFSSKPAWTGDIEITDCIDPASPGGRMFIMTARADDGRHLVLVQSPTYNKMLGNVVKAGQAVYTAPNGFKVWGGGPQKWFSNILLQSARASIQDPPSEDRIGYVLESPAGTFPALAVNGPVSNEELRTLADSLIPARDHLKGLKPELQEEHP